MAFSAGIISNEKPVTSKRGRASFLPLRSSLNADLIYGKDKIICAYDIKQGKPAPDPYLTAWERSGLPKENCCVVENAPLGVLSGKRAELVTVAVNTGILENHYFEEAGADVIFPSMEEFLAFLQQ